MVENTPSRLIAPESLAQALAGLPGSAVALWLRDPSTGTYVLVAARNELGTRIPLQLSSEAAAALCPTPEVAVLPLDELGDDANRLPPLFRSPGVALPLRWNDSEPAGILWCDLPAPIGRTADLERLTDLRAVLEAALDNVPLSMLVDEVWRTAPIPSCLLDGQWRILAANPAFLQLVGRTDVAARPLDDLLPAFPNWDSLRRQLAEDSAVEDVPLALVVNCQLQRFAARAVRIPLPGQPDPSIVLLHLFPELLRHVLPPPCPFLASPPESPALESPLQALVRLLDRLARRRPILLSIGVLRFPLLTQGSHQETAVAAIRSSLTKTIHDALEPDHLSWISPQALLIVTSARPEDTVAAALEDAARRVHRSYPFLSAWPFGTRVDFALVRLDPLPSTAAAVADLLHRLRDIALSTEETVTVLDPSEAWPTPPSPTEIASAVIAGQFAFVAQPIVPLRDSLAPRVELLARLRVGQRLLRPRLFLSTVEQLDRHQQLLSAALDSARVVAERGVVIHVNLPPTLLTRSGLFARELAAVHGDLAGRVTLEITDEQALADLRLLARFLEDLRMRGFAVALDDFGSGPQSLLSLAELPLDLLKVDQSVVLAATHEPFQVVLASVIESCHRRGILVVAEGVEHAHLLEQLRHWDCDYAQGMACGRPEPVSGRA
jgi:EAL domain-containing protein (putative c-di-GMP-specific phosphodiesterase class I)/PAS domain-containing protein